MSGFIETLGIIVVLILVACAVVNSFAQSEYVAECVLENPTILNIEEICESDISDITTPLKIHKKEKAA